MAHLETFSDVVEALGGREAVTELTGRVRTAFYNWQQRGFFPPELHLLMTGALADRGHTAAGILWRQDVIHTAVNNRSESVAGLPAKS